MVEHGDVMIENEFVISTVRRACLAKVTAVGRVTVLGDLGYLFFVKGDVVHATTMDLVGEPAALEILRWQDATFELCERRAPADRSIHKPWRELLEEASAAPLVVDVSVRDTPTPVLPVSQSPNLPPRDSNSAAAEPRSFSAARVRQAFSAPGLAPLLSIQDAHGAPADGYGHDSKLRAISGALLAFGDHVGAALGAGAVYALEIQDRNDSCVAARCDGEVMATRVSGSALTALRRALSL